MQLTDVITIAFVVIALIAFSGEFLEFILFGAIGLVTMLAVAFVLVVIKTAVGVYQYFKGD